MALLAGRPLEALEPDELEQVARWTELLADPETWEEPAPDLEDLVIASIGAAPRPPGAGPRPAGGPRGPGCGRCWAAWPRPRRSSPRSSSSAATAAIVPTRSLGHAGGDRAGPGRDGPGADLRGLGRLPGGAEGQRSAPAGRRPLLSGLLKGPSGSIPVGTFSKGDGSWVTLWSGSSPADFPTLTVTIEAPDGNQASSGELVLSGDTST